jgi:hypothetical protein
MKLRALAFLLAATIATGLCRRAQAIDVPDYAVLVTAQVSKQPPKINLQWEEDVNAKGYAISRRIAGDAAWIEYPGLPGTQLSFIDSSVSIGTAYEYRIVKNAQDGAIPYTGHGFIQTGIAVRPTHDRGKIILMVDQSVASPLETELRRLMDDLVGDGWVVIRHDVSRYAPVPEIKAIIRADYDADPSNVKAVFLFGHIPVAYSGDGNPDGHRDHQGAWPADAYYGDMDGVYTDETVNRTVAARPENHNIPGDGKFDPTVIPANGKTRVELEVGRVDLADLPAFRLPEVELLRRYLDKNHAYRHKLIRISPLGLIDDRFGAFVNEAFAVDGWRNFTPLITSQNIVNAHWMSSTQSATWLWGYACGPAGYTSIPGLVSTGDFANSSLNAAFVLMFGSYFGDWDSSDNLLRAPLAGAGITLSSVWAGRPHWHFHPMGLGETIGFCARMTQNEDLLGPFNIGVNEVHVALMGDPTLRLYPLATPRNLRVRTDSQNLKFIQWDAPLEAVGGCHIYVASSRGGPFRRLTATPIASKRFAIGNPSRAKTYMVRAAKMETTPSGSFLNQSQGITITLGGN